MLLSISAQAQQSPLFADYNYNTVLINPAFSGYYSDIDIALSHSQYLSDVEGRPQTFGANLNIPLLDQKMGVGLGVLSDEIGVLQTTSVTASYAYHIPLKKSVHDGRWYDKNPKGLSFGVAAALINWDESLTELGLVNDPEFARDINESLPTFHAGILYNDSNIFAGFSIINLIGNTMTSHSGISVSPTYYLHAGGRFFASRYAEDLLVTPSVLLKHVDGAPVQVDLNLLFNLQNKIQFGAGYRTTESVNLMVGITLGKYFNFLYQYTLTIANTSPLGNAHGIMMRVRLGEGLVF